MYSDNIPKETIDKYILENEAFNNYVLTLKNHCQQTKELFLQTEPFSLTGSIPGINFITNVYLSTVFFPDQDIYDKFLLFGIQRKELRWMDGIEEYERQFKNLEDQGVIIYKNEFMRHLMVHLSIQIQIDVFGWSEFYVETKKGKRPLTLTIEIENAIDRRIYNAHQEYKSDRKKQLLDAIAGEFLDIEEKEGLKKGTLLKLLKGQVTKSFYTDWLRLSFPYSEDVLKSNAFLQKVMPLFKMILKDKKMPETLDDVKEDGYAGKDLPGIQAQFLRKWIYKK